MTSSIPFIRVPNANKGDIQKATDAGALGIIMLLNARADARKELDAADRTMVGAHANNPLKLMSDPHEAMAFLFDPSERTVTSDVSIDDPFDTTISN